MHSLISHRKKCWFPSHRAISRLSWPQLSHSHRLNIILASSHTVGAYAFSKLIAPLGKWTLHKCRSILYNCTCKIQKKILFFRSYKLLGLNSECNCVVQNLETVYFIISYHYFLLNWSFSSYCFCQILKTSNVAPKLIQISGNHWECNLRIGPKWIVSGWDVIFDLNSVFASFGDTCFAFLKFWILWISWPFLN